MSFRPSYFELTGEGPEVPYQASGTRPLHHIEAKKLGLPRTNKKGKQYVYRWYWEAFYDYENQYGDVSRSVQMQRWEYTGLRKCTKCMITYDIEPGPSNCPKCGKELKNVFNEKWVIERGIVEPLTKELMALLSNWTECVDHRRERRAAK